MNKKPKNIKGTFACTVLLLEHQHQRILSYSILPSQRATLLLILYHFTIPQISQNFILQYNTLK